MANNEHLQILSEGVDVWNRWRKSNGKIKPDLKDSDLRNKVLSTTNSAYTKADGKRINLTNTDFSGALLQNSVLKGAFLKGANFQGANLTSANLRKSDLRHCNFSGAKLNQVNFTLCRMYKANFTDAHVWETIFSRVDISRIIGLEKCVQPGPSLIDDRTFKESRNIPEDFLKKCGLSDWQILASRLNDKTLTRTEITDICYEIADIRTDPMLQFYSCFISYSHKDKKFATKLHSDLQKEGIRCWLDDHQMLPGDDIYEEVDRGIRLWDKVLLCCSESSLSSWWVDNEIMSAFDKEQKLMSERGEKVYSLIPINLDNYLFSSEFNRGYKNQIKSRLAANFTNWENSRDVFRDQVSSLVKSLLVGDAKRDFVPESLL